MAIHELKIWPEHFEPLFQGKKCAEYRKNDRNFQEGDTIRFREYEPETNPMTLNHGSYTDRECYAVILHVATGIPMESGYALLSLARANISHPSPL